jgi:hypothetical protein
MKWGMRKLAGTILLFLLVAAGASFGKSDETTEELIARADAARPDQQPDLYMEVAQRAEKSAVEAYKADKIEDFRAALQQIVKYSDKARSAALQSGKRVKNTEIKIREIAIRLRDLKLNVDVDDQPPVQAAADQLESFRTELLHAMFGTGTKSDKQK